MSGNLFLRFPEGKAKALTFSYDDGVYCDIKLVVIFKKHGLKATFNINSGILGDGSSTANNGRLSVSQIKELYTPDLFEVACHGYTHPWLDKCDQAVALNEIAKDRLALEEIFNYEVHGCAYPYGTYNDTVIEVLKSAGIYYSRTTQSHCGFSLPNNWLTWHPTCHHKNPKLQELGDKLINAKNITHDPMLLYVWGHSYEFGNDNNWEIIEEFAEKIAGKNDIWYASNMEIYRYCRSFSRLKYSADGNIIYNPNADKIWFVDRQGKNYSINSGETLNLKAGE